MKRNGNTLVATLVVVVIMALLAFVIFKGGFGSSASTSSRADGLGTTIPGAAKLKAEDGVCKHNLSQIRQLIQISKISDEPPPASLQDIRSLPSEMYACPIGHEPYAYDPQTGNVACVHPGHENF